MHTTSFHRPERPWERLSVTGRALWSMRAVMAGIALKWVLEGNVVWASIAAACVGLSLVPELVIRNENLRAQTTITATGLMLAHICLGMDAGLYEVSSLYDKAAHFLGFGAITTNLFAALSRNWEPGVTALPLSASRLLAFLAAVSLGVAWEIFEFSVDLTGLVSAQKGLTDTMLDLICNTTGSAIAIAILTRHTPQTS